jgi:hypothetical protein
MIPNLIAAMLAGAMLVGLVVRLAGRWRVW